MHGQVSADMKTVWGCSKMPSCKAREKRTARRIVEYVKQCGLKRNTADGRIHQPKRLNLPRQIFDYGLIKPVDDILNMRGHPST